MMSKPVYHVGRILLAALFLTAGILKVTGFTGTVQYFSALGFPLPEAATALAIFVEVGGGLTLLLGTRFARQAALLLAVFTVAASLSAHQFWQHGEEFIPFLKNMALVGALLLFWNNRQTANNQAN